MIKMSNEEIATVLHRARDAYDPGYNDLSERERAVVDAQRSERHRQRKAASFLALSRAVKDHVQVKDGASASAVHRVLSLHVPVLNSRGDVICDHCWDGFDDHEQWPCATYRAVEASA